VQGAVPKIKARLRQDAGIGGDGAGNGAVIAGTGETNLPRCFVRLSHQTKLGFTVRLRVMYFCRVFKRLRAITGDPCKSCRSRINCS
jgi:hypothetical protein